MFDIGLPELMIILVLGLVLLGPDRLPGVIRQITGFIRMLRSSYGDALAVFKDQLGDVQEDIDAIRGEISSIQGEVRSTAEGVQKDVEKVEGEVKTAGADIQRGLDETAKEAARTRPDQVGAEANAPPAVAASPAPQRPAPSDRGPAWTPQGAQVGGGSPVQQDLFAGLMRSLKARLGDDWLVEQAEIYRDLGARAAGRNAGDEEDIAALVRTWADMHRNALPEGSLQIIETGRDYRVRMRQCPFSFAETDDVALCQSCGAYDLAYLAERAAEVKWESHLTAGDPWCELVFAKPPAPPPPDTEIEETEGEPAATTNGNDVSAAADADAVSDPQAEAVSTDAAPPPGAEFGTIAQAYGDAAEGSDASGSAVDETPKAETTEDASEAEPPAAAAAPASVAEPSAGDAPEAGDTTAKAAAGKKEPTA